MKINAINSSCSSASFGSLKIKSKSPEEKKIIDEFIERQARIGKDKVDIKALFASIDEVSDGRKCNLVIGANLKEDKNKTRVKSVDMFIEIQNADGTTGRPVKALGIEPESFIQKLKSFSYNIGVDFDKFAQTKKNG